MEYERIQKVQNGMLSPSKLRMMLIGSKHQRKNDGSNSNSPRTSPSKLHDSEFLSNSLLDLQDANFDDKDSGLEASCQPKNLLPRENGELGRVKMALQKAEVGNSSTVHPFRTQNEENLDYDSNASSSSFEFHKDDNKSVNHFGRSLFHGQIPSKWNDAEKWIINRKNSQANHSKKNVSQTQSNRILASHTVRVAPVEGSNAHKPISDRTTDTKRVDFCLPFSSQASGVNVSIVTRPESIDLHEADHQELSSSEYSTGTSIMRSVSMRDTGTEMTPITSQEPSQTATPIGATTPLRSPASSVPSTPKRGLASTPVDFIAVDEPHPTKNNNINMSEQDLKLKTRREIVALGVQLGKMNIATWASNDGKKKSNDNKTMDTIELDRIEFEKRAMAWEEAEKSKHTARYKREEIKIQAWESREKAKLEAELRKIEAKVEQIKAQAQAKMVKKISMAKQHSEERRAVAEAKKKEEAQRTTAKAEYIRQNGKLMSHFICCGWLR